MTPELQDKLYNSYPKLFRQKELSIEETCMSWGIRCDDGWYAVLECLCFLMQYSTDVTNHEQVEFIQIKEKFGSLRVYTDGHDDFQDALIDFACLMSTSTCEICGSTKDVFQMSSEYVKTVCQTCFDIQFLHILMTFEKHL